MLEIEVEIECKRKERNVLNRQPCLLFKRPVHLLPRRVWPGICDYIHRIMSASGVFPIWAAAACMKGTQVWDHYLLDVSITLFSHAQ